MTHLGPARCSTGSWRGAGLCPTGHWAGGEASDCLCHKKERDPHQLLTTEPAEAHPRTPNIPRPRGCWPQRGRTTASGHIGPVQWHCWFTSIPPIPLHPWTAADISPKQTGSQDLSNHTVLTLGSSSPAELGRCEVTWDCSG